MKDLSDLHLGSVDEEVNWRSAPDNDEDDDAPASKELIELLGVNPDELDYGEDN